MNVLFTTAVSLLSATGSRHGVFPQTAGRQKINVKLNTNWRTKS
jgi:hypothetical protein